MRTLVLGVGNRLLSDEGCGVLVVEHLRRKGIPQGVTLLDGGTLGFTLAQSIQDHDALVVVDAAQLQRPPGTVMLFEGAAMDRFLGRGRRSAHEVGLLDLLDIARLTGTLPTRRALVGIQPQSVQWGDQPGPAVAAAIPEAAAEVLQILRRWQPGAVRECV